MSKIKSYNFWVKLVSAIILIARIVLSKFGVEFDSALVIDIATLIAGLLVVLGIINEPTGITIAYDENCVENKNQNKGDHFMTEQIKLDLMDGVNKLNNAIKGNANTDAASIVQIITSMLDAISIDIENAQEKQIINEREEAESVENSNEVQICQEGVEVFDDVISEVIIEHSENEDEINSDAETEESIEELADVTGSLCEGPEVQDLDESVKTKIKEYVINHMDEILAS